VKVVAMKNARNLRRKLEKVIRTGKIKVLDSSVCFNERTWMS